MHGFDAVFAYSGQKNLLKITASTLVRNGITFTINESQGTIAATGTATANTDVFFATNQNISGDMILSGCPSGGSSSTYYMDARVNGSYGTHDYGDGVSFSGTCDTVAISILNGQTVNNLVFKPMIRDSRIASNEFVPWMAKRLVIKEEITLTISSGYTTLNYPTGINNTDYFTPIIQPRYSSFSLLGWTGTTQKQGDTACYIYVRQGTTTPANSTKITFDAIWIHR